MATYIPSAISTAQANARRRGDKTFTIEEPCKRGHTAPRYTSNNCCTTCIADYNNHRKPANERKMRLYTTSSTPITLAEDVQTVRLMAEAQEQFHAITGKPVSRSVIHKAGIILLANYLKGSVSAHQLRELIY